MLLSAEVLLSSLTQTHTQHKCGGCVTFICSQFHFFFLIYLFRITMDYNRLCPPVKYPVPVGTPLISPLVEWDHSQNWDVPKVEDFPSSSGGSSSATVYNIGQELTR